ncbi:uncharacterized protein LOC141665746 [Apium graveolens]|uniref:uncharacterized protein LOC141665746 n=1 Tax=Apium graveolens TaxID=4045 RepID=UPI003D7A907D
MYEAKKTLTDLGLEYIKFHACPNYCVLYRGPILESSSECPKCHLSRWKVGKDGQVRVNVPAKVMWYFPIIPIFKRMFKSSSTAELMSWHANNRNKDGKMRHPSDSPSWRNVDCPQEPGNDIDVYLQPLIDDLKKLWEEGEPNVYDAHIKSFFTLKAILMWTINDFPGYGNLSGCVNKGYRACPVCGDQTVAKYLSRSRKMSYQGHCRYLDLYHPYRRQRTAFNGEQEFGCAPEPLSGEEVLGQQQQLRFSFGKGGSQERWSLHGKNTPEVGEKRTYLPPAPYTLSRKEKKTILASLYDMKLPYGHASNIRNCVSMIYMKLYGLKSHDCHILLQQLLPVCIRSVLPKNVRVSIIRLCFFFNSLCNKVVDVSKLNKLQADVILTLCELEKIFPPSFFDVMIHLMVHLVRELRLCGPVFYRWMFPFERFNKILKSYVRNRFYPEGSIAEGYLKEESIEFCSEFYTGSSRTAGLPKDEEKISGPIGSVTMKSVAEKERDEAHLSVLRNNSEVEPYVM